jgi:hypothetical protein
MKTTTMILAALVFGIFYTTSGNAKSGTENQATEKQLTQTIQLLLRNAPLEDLMERNEKCNLEVQFSIDSYNKITDVQVNGKNPELVKYITRHLLHKKIQISSSLILRTYKINLLFALK